jgi:hypothetical protein
VRFHGEPFPLYPGEVLNDERNFGTSTRDYSKAIKKLPTLKANHGINLKARVDFDDNGIARNAEDKWQLEGPLTYHPNPIQFKFYSFKIIGTHILSCQNQTKKFFLSNLNLLIY